MGKLSNIYTNLLTNLGLNADVASSVDSVNAKLAQLLARIESAAQFEGTTGVLLQYPAATAVGITITGGAPAWTLGAWTQIVAASVLTGHVLVGFFCVTLNVNAKFQIDIGEGGSGAEVVKWRISFMGEAGGPQGAATKWLFPGYRVTPNARIAARAATSNASNTFEMFLYFAPRPI